MSVNVKTTIYIPCSREAVATYAMDPMNAPSWYDNIDTAVWVKGPPAKVGSQIAFIAQFLGKELRYTYEIIDYTVGHKMVMRTAEGPFPMETIYTFEDENEGCRMTLINQGNPSGFTVIVVPLMSWMMRRANNKDLKKIKTILVQS